MPLKPGRRTSNMRQSPLRAWSEFKNSSAEANTFTSKRADLISRSSDRRTEISSSTTETKGARLILYPLITCGRKKSTTPWWRTIAIGFSLSSRAKPGRAFLRLQMRPDPQILRHPDQIGQGIGAHLPHDVPAMKLYRVLGNFELGRYLLIQPSGDHLLHDSLLA